MPRICLFKRTSKAGHAPLAAALGSVLPLLALALVIAGAAPVSAEITQATLEGDVLEALIVLPGGGQAELAIAFEDTSGLSVERLGLSVSEVDPADPALLARLPVGTSLPADLPLVLRIEPEPGVKVTGLAWISLYTHDLDYTADSPLRVFAAPLGGGFADVTESGAPGSYRGGAVTPRFNKEFAIVEDERAREVVAALKLGELEAALLAGLEDIESATGVELLAHLDAILVAYDNGDYVAAVQATEAFIDTATAGSGSSIPDVWKVVGSAQNLAGDLRGKAWTLRYTLLQLANGLQ